MPDFAASLINPTTSKYDMVLDTTGDIIVVTDRSNYTTSTETGHAAANFDLYRKIIITDKNNLQYTFGSTGTADTVILPGNSGSNTFNYTMQPIPSDGVYKARLVTLPTWNSGITYTLALNAHVAKLISGSAKIYKLLAASSLNQAPESNPAVWSEVTDITLVHSKYNVLGYASVILRIWEIFLLAIEAATSENVTGNFDEQSRSRNAVIAQKLDLVIKSITHRSDQGQWDKAAWLIAEGLKICDAYEAG